MAQRQPITLRRSVCALLAPFFLQAQLPYDMQKLPVKRVVLYKNGVGYFEHQGKVRGNQDVTIPFTSGQLNDVLKSLTVLDLNGGRITGVTYGSVAPVERQLGDLRLPIGEKSSLTEFLGALRGARIEVRSGTTVITGRLLSIERKTRISGGTTLEVDYVSLLTDGGDLRTTEVSPSFSVRLLEKGLSGKVERYLDLASAAREADLRRMVISAEGAGERNLFVSYISEVPVWKATYRIVLSAKGGSGPLLQGWAIVDNTVGEDWDKVELSLVAGAPQSFIQNLSQPYYSRRPVVPLPESMNAAPQTYEATLIPGGATLTGLVTDPTGTVVAGATVKAYDGSGGLVGQATTKPNGEYELRLPYGPTRLEVEQAGFQRAVISGLMLSDVPARQDARLQVGSVSNTVEVRAEPSNIQTQNAEMSQVQVAANGRSLGSGSALGGRGGSFQKRAFAPPTGFGFGGIGAAIARSGVAAQAQELGDLFEYKLKEPITIRKNRSAMVPIVQAAIGAEKVSVWNEQAGLARPQRAMWLTNSTGVTLDGGSFSVLEEETFAGEGVFEPIRPDEKRLISYATDLALNASSKLASEQQRVSSVRVIHGVMTQRSQVREKKTYTFRNEDSSARSVIVEHPFRAGYELLTKDQLVETAPGSLRFRIRVEPKQTASLVVEEARPLEATYALTNITSDQVALLVRQKSIDRKLEDALRRILAQKDLVNGVESQKSEREDEVEKIFDDQQRLRENMKSLKGSADEKALVQRYVKQLNAEEDRLEALKKESADLEAKEDAERVKLNRMIEDLELDVKL
jgi:hypothetical protein